MQSNGGVATPEAWRATRATTLLSGPAGGPIAALAFARGRGSDDCIGVDMGGTSFDVAVVQDGEVQVTRQRRDQPARSRCR